MHFKKKKLVLDDKYHDRFNISFLAGCCLTGLQAKDKLVQSYNRTAMLAGYNCLHLLCTWVEMFSA